MKASVVCYRSFKNSSETLQTERAIIDKNSIGVQLQVSNSNIWRQLHFHYFYILQLEKRQYVWWIPLAGCFQQGQKDSQTGWDRPWDCRLSAWLGTMGHKHVPGGTIWLCQLYPCQENDTSWSHIFWEDIVCKYWKWAKKAGGVEGSGLKPALSVMHAKAHNWTCQVHCRFIAQLQFCLLVSADVSYQYRR